MRLVLVLLISPVTDGFFFTTESVSCILSFGNPYNHTFTSIPYNLLTKNSESVFAYLPFVTIFSTPFYLIGDIRYGFILSDILTGYAIYRMNSKSRRRAIIASSIYLFSPFTMGWTAWAGVNTTVGVSLAIISLMFLQEGRSAEAGVFFGLSLAALQLSWILIPFIFYYSLKNDMTKMPLYAIIVCGIVMSPFLVSGFRDMINDVLLFHLTRNTIPVFVMATFPHAEINISVNGFLYTLLGYVLPLYLKVLVLVPFLLVLVWASKDFQRTIYGGFLFVLVFLFVLPNNLLINYLALPFSLGLVVSFKNRKRLLETKLDRMLGFRVLNG